MSDIDDTVDGNVEPVGEPVETVVNEDRNNRFKRYTGFRPRFVDSRYPMYNPERDMGRINLWLQTVYHNIGASIDYLNPIAERMGLPTGQPLVDGLRQRLLVVIEYMEDARGAGILSEQEQIPEEQMLTYEEAMAKLQAVEPRWMVLLQSMFGFCAMDLLFFAARQDSYLGDPGKYTLIETGPTIQDYGNAIRLGKDTDKTASAGLRRAARLATLIGLPERAIYRSIEEGMRHVDGATE